MKKIIMIFLLLMIIPILAGCDDKYVCDSGLCWWYEYNVKKTDTTIEEKTDAKFRYTISGTGAKSYQTRTYGDGSEISKSACALVPATNDEDPSASIVNKDLTIKSSNLATGTKIYAEVTIYSDTNCRTKLRSLTTNELTIKVKGPGDGLEDAGDEGYYQLTSVSDTENMATEQKTREDNGGLDKVDYNCRCYSLAYAQKMNEGSTLDDYHIRPDVPTGCTEKEFGMKEGASGDAAYKQAFEYIVKHKQATVINIKSNSKSTGDCTNNHWVVVVGVSKAAYNDYVTDGKLNSAFDSAAGSKFEEALYLLDTWPKNKAKRLFGMGQRAEYYSSSKNCYFEGKGNTLRIPS